MPPECPGGTYAGGIYNEHFAARIGQLAAAWGHLDEALADILYDLLGHDYKLPLRQVYRSIVSPEARIAMLSTLLEKTELNQSKSRWYDDVLTEFRTLKSTRNDFLHDLWWTFEDGRMFISKIEADAHSFIAVEKLRLVRSTTSSRKYTTLVFGFGRAPVWLPRKLRNHCLKYLLPLPPKVSRKAHR